MTVTRAELLQRLPLHEDSFVERKLEGHDFKPTIVGFANSVPGGREAVLFIGVRDNGEITGVTNPDSLQKKIQRLCKDECYPAVSFTTELLTLEGRTVLAVVIPPSSHKPHFGGQAFIRDGNQSLTASEAQYDALILSRNSKVAELSAYRDREITIATVKRDLGRPEIVETRAGTALYGQMRRERATILDVNSFFVRFEQNHTRFSEPIDNLTISYDEEARRPLVFVHLTRP